MKEEFTSTMFSEFSVTQNTAIKHKCFCALKDMELHSYSIDFVCAIYGISVADIEKYKREFD